MTTAPTEQTVLVPPTAPVAVPRQILPSTLRRSYTSPWVQRLLNFANIASLFFYGALFLVLQFGPYKSVETSVIVNSVFSAFNVLVSIYGITITLGKDYLSPAVLYIHIPFNCARAAVSAVIAAHAYVSYITGSQDGMNVNTLRGMIFLFSIVVGPMNLASAFAYFFWVRAVVQERMMGVLMPLLDAGDHVVGRVVEAPPPVVDAVVADCNSVPSFYRREHGATYTSAA